MNPKSPLGFAEPMMKSSAHFSAGTLEAAQRVRACQKEGMDHIIGDYLQLFENLQATSNPQDALGLLNDHLQTRFAHSMKTWNDLRQALTQNQSTLMALVMDSMKAETRKLSKESAQSTHWMLDPVTSTLSQWNQMASALMPGDDGHAESDDGTARKGAASKPGKAHAAHSNHSAHTIHASRHV